MSNRILAATLAAILTAGALASGTASAASRGPIQAGNGTLLADKSRPDGGFRPGSQDAARAFWEYIGRSSGR